MVLDTILHCAVTGQEFRYYRSLQSFLTMPPEITKASLIQGDHRIAGSRGLLLPGTGEDPVGYDEIP